MWLAYLLHICNMTAATASALIVALHAAHLGAGAVVIGALIAVSAAPSVVLGVYAGRMSDRLGVRLPMLAGSSLMAAALALAALVPGLPVQFAAVALIGTGHLFYMVAQQAMVGALSTQATRARNFSNQTLVASLARFVGPLAAGFLIEHRGYAVTFGVFAVLPAIAAASLATGGAARACGAARPASTAQTATSHTRLVQHRSLLAIAITSGLVLTCVDLFAYHAPLHAAAAGLSPSWIGGLMGAYAAAAIAGRAVMPQMITLARGEERLLVATLVLALLAYGLFPLTGNPGALAGLAFLLGASLGCAQPLSMMMTYNYSPPGRSGEAMGLRFMISNGARLVLPLVLGPITGAFGLLAAFWSNAGILAGSSVLARRLARSAAGEPLSAVAKPARQERA